MDRSETLLTIVKRIKVQASEAEKNFDSLANDIQRKSKKDIDLFGGQASSQVVEIASMVREACDGLYVHYQTLVKIADEECRPLLNEETSTHAVKEVLELIRWLNSESAVGTNFSGSLNGIDLGDLVSVKYIPTIENKMIQTYWESKYSEMPGTEEEDKAYNIRQREERRTKREAAIKEREKEAELRYKEWEYEYNREKDEEKQRLEHNQKNKSVREEKRKYYSLAREIWDANYQIFGYVKGDGTGLVEYDYNLGSPKPSIDISKHTNLKSIVCTCDGYVGLKHDGTCVFGFNNYPLYYMLSDVKKWHNIKSLTAGNHYVVGIRIDGTCVATSIKQNVCCNANGRTDVDKWTDIKEVSCGDWCTLGLREDGTVVVVGEDYVDEIKRTVKKWKDIELIAAGNKGVIAMNKKGEFLTAGTIDMKAMRNARDVIQLVVVQDVAYALQADGKVLGGIVYKYADENETTIEAANNIIAITAGSGEVLLLKENGSIHRLEVGLNRKPKGTKYNLFRTYEERLSVIKAIEEEKKRMEEENKQKEAENKQKEEYRRAGVCQHCGGKFQKGFFSSKCISCGRKKDY